jgi:hypothetical protein
MRTPKPAIWIKCMVSSTWKSALYLHNFAMFSNKPTYTSKGQSSAFPKTHSDKSTNFHDKNV